ncbi:MAG TPA: MFS transporter [Streptosporangiaceae bacterium]|nr:MFS transporter [Streptosporangiaceae bacterium]
MRIGQIAIDTTPLRQSKDFRLLFTGRMVSQAGNAIATTAANWQVFALTHSSLHVGLLTLANSAGQFAGMLTGGILADTYDRRLVMLASRVPLTLVAAALTVNSLFHHPLLWAVYVLVLASGALSGLGSPASTAAVPAVVRTDQLPAAAALNAMGGQLGQLGGPALAGILIAGPGLAVCYGIDAACLAVFGITLWFIRPLPPTMTAPTGMVSASTGIRPGLRSMAEGLRYVTRNSVVGGMLAVDTSAMIFGMPSALFPAIASEHFHGGSATFGLLASAPGFGALLGAATSGWTGRLRRPGVVVIIAGLAWGAAIVAFGLSDNLALSLAFLALAGMADLFSEVLRNTLLQLYTPDQLRGRVTSVYLAQVTTAPSLGNFEAGLVAQLFSTTISVVSGGLVCVAGALLLGVLNPALRNASLAGPTPAADPGTELTPPEPAST